MPLSAGVFPVQPVAEKNRLVLACAETPRPASVIATIPILPYMELSHLKSNDGNERDRSDAHIDRQRVSDSLELRPGIGPDQQKGHEHLVVAMHDRRHDPRPRPASQG